MNVPGNGIPYCESAGATVVFSRPSARIVFDPASASSGKAIPRRLVKSARIAGES